MNQITSKREKGGEMTANYLSIFLALLFFVNFPNVYGQTVFDPGNAWIDTTDSRYYEQVIARYQKDIERSRWIPIFTELTEDFRNTSVDWSDNNKIKNVFIAGMSELLGELMQIEIFYDGNYNGNLSRIRTMRFSEGVTGDGFVAFTSLNSSIVLCMEGFENLLPCNDSQHVVLTETQAEDIRYRANTFDELLSILKGDAQKKFSVAIEKKHKRWRNVMDRGFTMYPWEVSVNSWLKSWNIRSPPARQFILLHPSLGIQVPLDGVNNAADIRIKEALLIELLGHVWYRGENLRNYGGFSVTAVFRDDLSPGIGGHIHLKRGISAGLNWHLSGQENKRFMKSPFITFNIDLLTLFSSNRGAFESVLAE